MSRLSTSNVGSAVNAAWSAWLRSAVVWNTVLALVISPRSWPRRSDSAPNTTPVFRTSRCTAPCWDTRTFSTRSVSVANGSRLPRVLLMSSPRPRTPWASDCIHTLNELRVRSSKARKISSSSTLGATCRGLSVPPSGSRLADFVPGVSST
ncbi:MAG: hypothetical protein E6G30_02240 [Actinobacteria bacterium]|nr:MAG: hypothetical protein E6G30_02240 [Actinomycetota bacterium]